MKEHEFKFLASKNTLKEILSHDSFDDFMVCDVEHDNHEDSYLDTKDLFLLKNKACLRIREGTSRYPLLVTFKKQIKKPENGEFERKEVEEWIDQFEADKISMGLSLTHAAQEAQKLVKNQPLEEILKIRNKRLSLILVDFACQRMDLSVDELKFIKDGRESFGWEVELENKSASTRAFKKTAEHIKLRFNLKEAQTSKYERGLKALKRQEKNLDEGVLEATKTIERLLGLKTPVFVHIAGGSCSGKTEKVRNVLAEKFIEAGIDILEITMDDYFISGKKNWDEPKALDLDMFAVHEKLLQENHEILKPVYSISTGNRMGFERVYPKKLILVDGIFALLEESSSLADLKIFVQTSQEERLARRVKRDSGKNARTKMSADSVRKYFLEVVAPMHDLYVEPTKDEADLVIINE